MLVLLLAQVKHATELFLHLSFFFFKLALFHLLTFRVILHELRCMFSRESQMVGEKRKKKERFSSLRSSFFFFLRVTVSLPRQR